MAGFETGDELHKRLDELEDEMRRVQARGAPGPAHQREGEAIREKGMALRRKLETAQQSGWEEARHELHEEWEALIRSMEGWARRVDQRYDKR